MRRAAVLASFLCIIGTARPGAQAQAPPNILRIISDDHAWSDHGFMGHPTVRTPSLDRLAASGILYTRRELRASIDRWWRVPD